MTRLISGLALAITAVALILYLPLVGLRVVACLVAALAADEYLRIVGRRRPVTHVVAMLLVVGATWWTSVGWPISAPGLAAIGIGWLAIEVLFENRPIQAAAADLMAPVYIGVPIGMLVAVQQIGGPHATLLLMGAVVVSDSAQYYCGRAFGRRPLAPAISPKKTIEGAIGGVVFGVAFLVVAGGYIVPTASVLSRALFGAAIVALGILGDLFESRLKRAADIKDSSSLIPGHGGVLDRVDALLFAIPAFHLLLLRTLA